MTYRGTMGLVVTRAIINDPEVIAEALHWTKGARGEAVGPGDAEQCDLSEFQRTAVCLGARVLHATADSATAISLAGTLTQLAERVETAGTSLVEDAVRATTRAVDVTAKATKEVTEETAKIIDSARERFHQDLATVSPRRWMAPAGPGPSAGRQRRGGHRRH